MLLVLGAVTDTTTRAVAGTYSVWYCQGSADRGISGAERDWSRSGGGAGSPPEDIVTCPGDLDQPSGAITTTVEANPNNSADEVIADAQLFAPVYVTLSHVNLWWNLFVNDGSQVAAIADLHPWLGHQDDCGRRGRRPRRHNHRRVDAHTTAARRGLADPRRHHRNPHAAPRPPARAISAVSSCRNGTSSDTIIILSRDFAAERRMQADEMEQRGVRQTCARGRAVACL